MNNPIEMMNIEDQHDLMDFQADDRWLERSVLFGLGDRCRARIAIINLHRLLGRKYGTAPLWAIVSDVWGHGSTVSGEICIACGFAPDQQCRNKELKPNNQDMP